MFKFSAEYIQQLVQMIFDGTITKNDLPEQLYHDIADSLKNGLYKGFGIDYDSLTKQINEEVGKFTEGDLELLSELRDNVYMFSAAKTYQQVKEMSEALIDNDGIVRPFKEFEETASGVFDQYNKNWLKTEYETAIGQGQSAIKWAGIERQKDVLPILRYSTSGGDVCDICAPLDGLTAKVDDPVWASIMPLNHFNCMCIVEQEEEGIELTPDGDKEDVFNQAMGNMQSDFKMNAGKDGYIFKPDHPYFTVPKEDKGFAQANFDLPIPKRDK